MGAIGKIITTILTDQDSQTSPSEKVYRINGQPLDISKFNSEKFWKNEFIKSMQELCPTFSVDERNKDLVNSLYQYAWRMDECSFDVNKGLLLWGGLGVGKSTLLKGLRMYEGKINRFAYACNNELLGFTILSAAELSLRYAEKGVDAITEYSGKRNLAIDEVGREPTDSKHYGTNVNPVQLVLQLRYENRLHGLTHMTTNLNPYSGFGAYGEYIVDRLKEMFNVIEITGESRR